MNDNTPEKAATPSAKGADGLDGDGNRVPATETPATETPASRTSAAEGPASPEPVYELVEVTPDAASASEPVPASDGTAAEKADAAGTTAAEPEPAPRPATSAASMQTIYVPAPVPPRRTGNRGFGVAIALLSSVVFAALYALAIAAIHAVQVGEFRFDFFASPAFYTPIVLFFVGFVLLVLVVNRASWWAYVVGSLFVALFVYFGTVGTGLLINNVFAETPANAARLFAQALANPFIIAAALLAREVSMWMGAAISARGRRVKARNLEAREVFERDSAARTADYESARYGTRDATA